MNRTNSKAIYPGSKALYHTSPFGAVFQCALHFATLSETTKSVLRLAADLDLEALHDVERGAIRLCQLKSGVRRDLHWLASHINGTMAATTARDMQLTVGIGLG